MSGAGEETVAKLLELGEHPDTADDVRVTMHDVLRCPDPMMP